MRIATFCLLALILFSGPLKSEEKAPVPVPVPEPNDDNGPGRVADRRQPLIEFVDTGEEETSNGLQHDHFVAR